MREWPRPPVEAFAGKARGFPRAQLPELLVDSPHPPAEPQPACEPAQERLVVHRPQEQVVSIHRVRAAVADEPPRQPVRYSLAAGRTTRDGVHARLPAEETHRAP